MRAVRDHTDAALIFLNDSPPQNEEQKKHLNAIRQVHASAMTKARYAEDMMTNNATRDVHERVEEHVKVAIENFYLLGQLLASPELAAKLNAQNQLPPLPFGQAQSGSTPLLAQPGESAFDMWCLTDPEARERFQNDREAVKAIKTLWSLDPDPRRTLEIQAEINARFERGDIAFATDHYGKKLGHFFCAPWGAVYVAKRSQNLGGRRLTAMQQFIFNVTCEGVNLGAPFEREIMKGNFNPTTKFEYGDPNEAPDH